MMEEFESPTYVLDLKDNLNWARIERAELGAPIEVFVRPDNTTLHASRIAAKGTLKEVEGGRIFEIEVKTESGVQTHCWIWEILEDAVRISRRDHLRT
jgi:hypothetical protein